MYISSIVLFAPLFYTISLAYIPSLVEVARTMAAVEPSTNFAQLWVELQGDALTTSALSTRDPDQMQAAMLLAGRVMAMGVLLPVVTNGLSTLCEIITSSSIRDQFFSDHVFEEKKREVMAKRELYKNQYRLEWRHEMEKFPFRDILFVCRSAVPLSVKLAAVKATSVSRSVTALNNFELGNNMVSLELYPLLNRSFKQLLQATQRRDLGRSMLQLAVGYELLSHRDGGESTPASSWLYTVIKEMLTGSEFFRINNRTGAFKLVLLKNDSLGYCYSIIGQLLGLALKNGVTIPGSLDKWLLHNIILYPTHEQMDAMPSQFQALRFGFYSVISMDAIGGTMFNTVNLITEQELNDIFIGKF